MPATLQRFFTAEEVLRRVQPFLGSVVGLFGEANEIRAEDGSAEFFVFSSAICDVTRLDPRIDYGLASGLHLAGAGAGPIRDLARAKAYCEAIERYCATVADPASFRVASRDELGEEAVDLELFPRCSPEEYENPRNYLVPPSNRERMRWVRGYSLVSGEPRWVPVVAVYLGMGYSHAGEAFTLPISTGCALAASLEQAIVTGICELIERDSIMLTWLQRLPLPALDLERSGRADLLEHEARALRAGYVTRVFDATSDLGIPTIIAVQLSSHVRPAALVMAATRLEPCEAVLKVFEEAVASRHAIRSLLRSPLPFDPAEFATFSRLTDGASFYADAANLQAFDFLLAAGRSGRGLQELPVLAGQDPQMELARLIGIFRARGLELIAVDLTLPEIRDEGFRAVKVIAPQLMPLAIDHNARFTATERLYEAPLRMGHRVARREELNPWPQPFA